MEVRVGKKRLIPSTQMDMINVAEQDVDVFVSRVDVYIDNEFITASLGANHFRSPYLAYDEAVARSLKMGLDAQKSFSLNFLFNKGMPI